jgi:hypothetical protein
MVFPSRCPWIPGERKKFPIGKILKSKDGRQRSHGKKFQNSFFFSHSYISWSFYGSEENITLLNFL